MPLINFGRRGNKIIRKGNLSRNSQELVSLHQAPSELKGNVTFSMLGRAHCAALPGEAIPVCNYSSSRKSWASNKAGLPGPPLKWKQSGPRVPPKSPTGSGGHWAPWILPPSPWASWEGEGVPTGVSAWLLCLGLVNTFPSAIAAAFPHFWINSQNSRMFLGNNN